MIFVFNKDCKEAFEELKVRLTSASILGHYNSERKIMLKLNILDEVIASIFSQLNLIDKQ
jgi:hypothetical protein